jgi:hypothetical protein
MKKNERKRRVSAGLFVGLSRRRKKSSQLPHTSLIFIILYFNNNLIIGL